MESSEISTSQWFVLLKVRYQNHTQMLKSFVFQFCPFLTSIMWYLLLQNKCYKQLRRSVILYFDPLWPPKGGVQRGSRQNQLLPGVLSTRPLLIAYSHAVRITPPHNSPLSGVKVQKFNHLLLLFSISVWLLRGIYGKGWGFGEGSKCPVPQRTLRKIRRVQHRLVAK